MKNANVKSTCRRFFDTEKKYGQKKLSNTIQNFACTFTYWIQKP